MDLRTIPNVIDFNVELKQHGFKVFEVDTKRCIARSFDRKSFYKICIITGGNIIQYADRSFEVSGTTLFFGNPLIPYSWENITEQTGYTCYFSEDFFKTQDRSESLQESPLFKIGGTPIFALDVLQTDFISSLFQRMIMEQQTGYAFKQDLIRNYINLIIHEALKMQPSERYTWHKDASSRIAIQFIELLEKQFPIEQLDKPLRLKTAQAYAEKLAIHVNHLNRSVKQVTGKSTTAHITERIVVEAKALLVHTDWSIADIAYALGFDYPTYFNNFFKRMTGTAPKSLRT
jgi:AraC family transcriptional activator of pobA